MTGGTEIQITGDPIPTRYEETEERLLRQLKQITGLPLGSIVSRAAKFALPKFASGEVNILTLEPVRSPVPLNGTNAGSETEEPTDA